MGLFAKYEEFIVKYFYTWVGVKLELFAFTHAQDVNSAFCNISNQIT